MRGIDLVLVERSILFVVSVQLNLTSGGTKDADNLDLFYLFLLLETPV